MRKSGADYKMICEYLDVKTFNFDDFDIDRMSADIAEIIDYFIDIYEVGMTVE